MKKRAKIILSRQLNENYSGKEVNLDENVVQKDQRPVQEEEDYVEKEEESSEENDYVGHIDVKDFIFVQN